MAIANVDHDNICLWADDAIDQLFELFDSCVSCLSSRTVSRRTFQLGSEGLSAGMLHLTITDGVESNLESNWFDSTAIKLTGGCPELDSHSSF